MLNALDQSLHKLEHIQGGSLFLFFSLLDEWTIWCSSYLPQLILFWQLINTTYTYFTHKIWNRRKSTLSTVSPLDTKGHCFHPRHQSQVNKYTIPHKIHFALVDKCYQTQCFLLFNLYLIYYPRKKTNIWKPYYTFN